MLRILIVRLSALGDLVHTLPVVASLKRAFPDAQIDWLVDDRFQELVELVPVVHASIAWPTRGPRRLPKLARVIKQLRRTQYEVAVDVQGLVKSAAAARMSAARRIVGFERSFLREPGAGSLYTEAVSVHDAPHVAQKNLLLAAHLGGSTTDWQFPISVRASEAVAETRRRLRLSQDARFAVLNPGTAWDSKCWDPSRFGNLASRLRADCDLRSVVTWGPVDEARAVATVESSDGAATLAPPTGIADLVAYARAASIVVAGDTGPLHLAAAVGAPVVGIYGPSDPRRNGPWDTDDEVVSRFESCGCRSGPRGVGQGVVVRRCDQAPSCMAEITVDDVMRAVARRLERVRRHA